MFNKTSIPAGTNYNEIWRDFKISLFSSYSQEKWRAELIDIDSTTYELMRNDTEKLFFNTSGYLKYLDFDSIYKLAKEVTAEQVVKNISKNKKCFFERDNINTLDKCYLIKQRICNNCKNVFDINRKINVVFLQTMIIDKIYQNYEVDFNYSFLDIEKLAKNEPNKLVFAINSLLNSYDLSSEEAIELSQNYNIDPSNFQNFANQFKCLKKSKNNQVEIDFDMEAA